MLSGILVLIALILVITISLMWSVVKRQLAERRLFYVRPPANSTVVITKDNSPVKVYINCNDQKIIDRLKKSFGIKDDDKITEKKTPGWLKKIFKTKEGDEVYQKEGKKIIFLRKGALAWVGMPWIYKVHEWYETQVDANNPDIDPFWYQTLQQRTLDFHFTEAKEEEAVNTSDMVQVEGKLVLQAVTFDPLKTIFAVQYWTEALRAKIFARWRKKVSQYPYFRASIDMKKLLNPKTNGGLFEEMINPVLSQKVHGALLKDLGLLKGVDPWDSDEPPENALPLPIGDLPAEGTIAYEVYNDWGIMFTLEVKDIDIADEAMRNRLEELKQISINIMKDLMDKFAKAQGQKLEGFKENEILANLAKLLSKSDGGKILLTGKAMGEALSTTDTFVAGTGGIEQILTLFQSALSFNKKKTAKKGVAE